jgi:membrane protease YdiL (CAAX protease family)
MDTARIDLKQLAFVLVGVALIETAAAAAADTLRPDSLLLTTGTRLAELGWMAAIIAAFGPGLPALGLARAKAASGLARGCLWAAGFGLLAAVAGLVALASGTNPLAMVRTAVPEKTAAVVSLFLAGGVVGPAAEEFFFRGVLYGFLRRFGVVPAVIVTTLLFAYLHPISGIAITQIVGGVLFAASYECEGNLLVPFTIHALGNSAIFTLSLLA